MKRRKRRRLAYGIIVVAFILTCFATYSYLNPSNQTPTDENPPNQTFKAAIVDHLSFKNETANQTFVDASKNILNETGFYVDYYGGNQVNITFYIHLLSHGYSLIIFRVHSAMIEGLDSLCLFTSELEDESKYNTTSAPYYDDVANNRTVRAYFPEDPNTHYFAIAPGFVEEYGNFQNSTIIIMGCDGLKNNKMAEAFSEKGAKVCIGWNGLVSTPHTDHATTVLLQHLAQGDTIEKAVNKTMDEVGPEKLFFKSQGYNSSLEYYPPAVGSYPIRYTLDLFNLDCVKANVILAKEEKKGTAKLQAITSLLLSARSF